MKMAIIDRETTLKAPDSDSRLCLQVVSTRFPLAIDQSCDFEKTGILRDAGDRG
jgi:hypothetical protein